MGRDVQSDVIFKAKVIPKLILIDAECQMCTDCNLDCIDCIDLYRFVFLCGRTRRVHRICTRRSLRRRASHIGLSPQIPPWTSCNIQHPYRTYPKISQDGTSRSDRLDQLVQIDRNFCHRASGSSGQSRSAGHRQGDAADLPKPLKFSRPVHFCNRH